LGEFVKVKGRKYKIVKQKPFWLSKPRYEAFLEGFKFYDYFLVEHAPTRSGLIKKLRGIK
jgi:hypothetical protein